MQPPPALFPASFALDDAHSLLTNIVDAGGWLLQVSSLPFLSALGRLQSLGSLAVRQWGLDCTAAAQILPVLISHSPTCPAAAAHGMQPPATPDISSGSISSGRGTADVEAATGIASALSCLTLSGGSAPAGTGGGAGAVASRDIGSGSGEGVGTADRASAQGPTASGAGPAATAAIDAALAALQQAVADAGEGAANSPAVEAAAAAVAAAAAAAVDTSGASMRAADYGNLLQEMQARSAMTWKVLAGLQRVAHWLPCCWLAAYRHACFAPGVHSLPNRKGLAGIPQSCSLCLRPTISPGSLP